MADQNLTVPAGSLIDSAPTTGPFAAGENYDPVAFRNAMTTIQNLAGKETVWVNGEPVKVPAIPKGTCVRRITQAS